MKLRIVHFLQVVLLIIGGLMTIADKIKDIHIIPDAWTPYWGLVVAIAVAVKPVVILLTDYLNTNNK